MNVKDKALYSLLTSNAAKGQSYIDANWASFEHIVEFLDPAQITEHREAFIGFFKARLASKISVDKWLFSPDKIILDQNKMQVLKPLIAEGLLKIPPAKFMYIYQKQEDMEEKDDNLFGFDFIEEVMNMDIKKIKQKIMNYKLRGK